MVAICEEWCMWWREKRGEGSQRSSVEMQSLRPMYTCECVNVCIWTGFCEQGQGKGDGAKGEGHNALGEGDQICGVRWWKCERSKCVWVLQELAR